MGVEELKMVLSKSLMSLVTMRLESTAFLHPCTEILTRLLLGRGVNLIRGSITRISALSILTARATNPLLLLLEVGGRATPYSLPNCFTPLGPSSSRKKIPFTMSLGYGLISTPLQEVVISGNLPAAQAQSSNVPEAGQTTSSMVPTSNFMSPSGLLCPPSRCNMAAISLRMPYSAVWLFLLWKAVPQLNAICAPLPPLWRLRVRSKRYLRKSRSSTRAAVVLQHRVLPSMGKSRFTSTFPGKVFLLLMSKPEGLAMGKQTMRLALRRGQAQRSVCGPMTSSPCMPETRRTVRSLTAVGSTDSKQKNWHLLPPQVSPSCARPETLKVSSLGTMACQAARYCWQAVQRLKGAAVAERRAKARATMRRSQEIDM